MSVEPWEQLDSRPAGEYRVFRTRLDRSRSPRNGQEGTFVVLEAPDWVNVIPLTARGEVILIRQFRHGIRATTLELPGGMVDPGETAEEAGLRELREETGFVSDSWKTLGWVHPNPAIQTNRCHTLLAQNCTLEGERQLDAHEDVEVVLAPVDDLRRLIREQKITHSLVVAAVYRFLEEG